MKKYIPFIIFCILTLFWVGFIFSNSAKTGLESGAASSAVVEYVEALLQKLGIEPEVSEHFIRKLAHFLEYTLLSLLVCTDVIAIIPKGELTCKRYPMFIIAPAFSFVIANIDEFCVQSATVGRGPSFGDVCIDTAGALTGTLAFVFVIFIVSVMKNNKKIS